MSLVGKHRVYRFSTNYSASVEPAVYSINGAKLTGIRNSKSASTNTLAAVDLIYRETGEFPSSSTQMPPVYVPKAPAWGPTWGTSVCLSPTATKRQLYTANMDEIYLTEWDQDATTQEMSNFTRAGTVSVPIYWSTIGQRDNLLSAEVDPIIKFRLAEAMSYIPTTNRLYFPIGTGGQQGLAALNIASEFSDSTWTARQADLRNTYGYSLGINQRFLVQCAASDDYVVVSQYRGGCAFYDSVTLEWKGHLFLPPWQAETLSVAGITIQEFDEKKILAVVVSPAKYKDDNRINKVPKVLFYDVDAIDAADLYQTIPTAAAMADPAGTLIPMAVVFGSGSVHMDPPPLLYGLGMGEVPNTAVDISTSPDPVNRILLATRALYWSEIYDISHLMIADAVSHAWDATTGGENPASVPATYADLVASVSGAGCAGLGDPAGSTYDNVLTISEWAETVAFSAQPRGVYGQSTFAGKQSTRPRIGLSYLNDLPVELPSIPAGAPPSTRESLEGPQFGARARHSWGEQNPGDGTAPLYLNYFTIYGGTCFAGSYLLLDGRAIAKNGGAAKDGFAVVSMESSSIYLADYKVNLGGALQAQLGLSSQMETYSDLTFLPSSDNSYGGWVVGTVRASLNALIAQLPPEDDLDVIITSSHDPSYSPWAYNPSDVYNTSYYSASWEPTGTLGLCLSPPGWEWHPQEYYSSSYYRFPGGPQATAFKYLGKGDPQGSPAPGTSSGSHGFEQVYQIVYPVTEGSALLYCTGSQEFDPAQRSGHQYKSFEVNVNASMSLNAWYPYNYPGQEAMPTLEQINNRGGFEILGADGLTASADDRSGDVIFASDRASNATYAFSANPGTPSTMLDKTGWIYLARDCAVAECAVADKSWVANVGHTVPRIDFARWDETSKTFDTNLAADSHFIRVPSCHADIDAVTKPKQAVEGQTFQFFGALGIRAPIKDAYGTQVEPVELSNTVTHIWGSLANENSRLGIEGDRLFESIILEVAKMEAAAASPSPAPEDHAELGYVSCAASLNRFRRKGGYDGTMVAVNSEVQLAYGAGPTNLGWLEIWDAKQIGKYLISWVNEIDVATKDIKAHYIGVHELTWSQETGTGATGSLKYNYEDVMFWTTQGEPTEDMLIAKPVRVLRLTDFSLHGEAEGNTVVISPEEDYVAAGNKLAMYLLYAGTSDLSTSYGYPKPVGSLAMGYSAAPACEPGTLSWRGWPKDAGLMALYTGSISDPLSGATTTLRTPVAPTWPLIHPDGTPFPAPADPRRPAIGSPSDPGQIPFTSVALNTSQFRQEGDNLYLYLQTIPWTLWRVDKTAAEAYAALTNPEGMGATEVLELVGALDMDQIDSRARYSCRVRGNIYWFGDMGAFTT